MELYIIMETILENKLQIFIFRSRNQQFKYWGQREAEWCEKYKDYFTIIDDGEGQIEHNIFKVMKISDFKNPLYLDNKTFHQGVGLLNIANNLDQFDYQYIGFVHMDMFPFYLNQTYFDSEFKRGYPSKKQKLLNFDNTLEQINKNEQYLFSFAILIALSVFSWHIQTFDIAINENKDTLWDYLSQRFNLFNILSLTQEQINDLKLPIACSFLAKKNYWKKLQLFIDNLDQLQNIEKYGYKITSCKGDKNIIISQMVQAFVELTILDYIRNNKVNFTLIPICHFN